VVKIRIPLPVWRKCVFFGFRRKTIGSYTFWDSNLVASLVKNRGLRSVERLTRFVWQTDRQTDFIICPMLLMFLRRQIFRFCTALYGGVLHDSGLPIVAVMRTHVLR